MKTIRERAQERYPEEEPLSPKRRGFFAGANSEHDELTRWNSPDRPPKDRRPVLLKMINEVNGLICYAVASYIEGRFLYPEMLPKNKILGWREIHE